VSFGFKSHILYLDSTIEK